MEILLNYCDTCFETTFQRNGVKLKCFAPVFEHITRNKRQKKDKKILFLIVIKNLFFFPRNTSHFRLENDAQKISDKQFYVK